MIERNQRDFPSGPQKRGLKHPGTSWRIFQQAMFDFSTCMNALGDLPLIWIIRYFIYLIIYLLIWFDMIWFIDWLIILTPLLNLQFSVLWYSGWVPQQRPKFFGLDRSSWTIRSRSQLNQSQESRRICEKSWAFEPSDAVCSESISRSSKS